MRIGVHFAGVEDVLVFAPLLNQAAGDTALDPSERIAELRKLRDRVLSMKQSGSARLADCDDLLGQADTYIGSLELQREAQAMGAMFDSAGSREDADVRDMLIAQGSATPDELDAAGWPSHDALDAAAEDGAPMWRAAVPADKEAR